METSEGQTQQLRQICQALGRTKIPHPKLRLYLQEQLVKFFYLVLPKYNKTTSTPRKADSNQANETKHPTTENDKNLWPNFLVECVLPILNRRLCRL